MLAKMDEFMINKPPSSEALAAARKMNLMLNSEESGMFLSERVQMVARLIDRHFAELQKDKERLDKAEYLSLYAP